MDFNICRTAVSPSALRAALSPSLMADAPSWTVVPMPDTAGFHSDFHSDRTRVGTPAVNYIRNAGRNVAALAKQGAPPRGEPR